MKTLAVTLDTTTAVELLKTLNKTDNVSLLIKVANNIHTTLEVWVDGNATTHRLVLSSNGTWMLNTELPV